MIKGSIQEEDITTVNIYAPTHIWPINFMTKEPRLYNGEGTVSSINSVGETGQPQRKE